MPNAQIFLGSLQAKNFRNYQEVACEFSPHINLFVGENAQGKTNFLEGISLISTGKSFRTSKYSELISSGSDLFFLQGECYRQSVHSRTSIGYSMAEKKISIGKKEHKAFSSLLGHLPAVVLSPCDVGVVMGAPIVRRRLIDLHIAQYNPLYVFHLSRFHGAMKQRNHLLKEGSFSTIRPWEEMMAKSAAFIAHARYDSIAELRSPLKSLSLELSGGRDNLTVQIETWFPLRSIKTVDLEILYLEKLEKNRLKERELGTTLEGPHRDDLLFMIADKNARLYASEGQKRSCMAAIRLAQWEQLHTILGENPLLLIDDFGVHLDALRRGFLEEKLKSCGQVFITSPFPLNLGTCATFSVSSGSIIPVDAMEQCMT